MLTRRRIPALCALLALVAGCGSSESNDVPATKSDAGADVQEAAAEETSAGDGGGDADATDATDALEDAGLSPRFDDLVEAIEKERVSLGAPGVAVAVLEHGEVTFAQGFGSKDPASDDPVLATTLFRIGSVTKMMTAVAVLQEVEAGDVDLDAPMTTYLPGYDFELNSAWASSITVRHLLTHQSAIVDYLEIDDSPVSDADLESFMFGPFAEGAYLMAPAGRMYNYSNPGFMLAGLVAQKVAGTPYRALMQDKVFTPLAMDRTYFDPADVIADGDYALGDAVHWETGLPLVVHPDTYDNGWATPAGYAFSSVLDLAKFVQFLRAGNPAVLSDSLREAMQEPHVDTKDFLDRMGYGYGLIIQQGVFLGPFYDIKIVAHGGAIPGFAADMYYVPACDLGFITLSNTAGAYYQESLFTALTTLCDLPAPSTAPDLTVDPTTFDRYVGSFVDEYNAGAIHVTRDGNDLLVQMPDVEAANVPYEPKLEPTLPDNFMLTIQGIQVPVTFLFDAQGQVEYFRTRPFVAERHDIDGGVTTSQPLVVTKGKDALLARLRAIHAERGPVLMMR